ncbi:EscT/YscT/HrcT family type III secretion system export apparatus protein [Vibrio zhanjiangensis]|uniref:EscT/YscT/HrcT family type III secretion system export apparatus protein n=1 Tax=Vibrio zhanjiangensis TaxID=1046128 RepID=A0ABQ6EXA7_9VIBR|nr:type III secretion system export apparatus subunit SctT [Vibrio zhanjiangensis]GLT17813.1 EscT/YscT/HrcT family type III secretion system export apparatus protein [Vibrio zhanjiangensis]
MDGLNELLISFGLCLPRLIGAMILIPGFSTRVLGGQMVRNTIAAVLALPLFPVVSADMNQLDTTSFLAAIAIKEALIGLLIGFITAIPFQAIESAGFIIDNQRGASMAMTMNPLSNEQTSPLGILLNQAGCAIFFSFGFVLIWLGAMYHSYVLWPVNDMLPPFAQNATLTALQAFSHIMEIAWRLAAPAVIVMFLAEFGLGLMNRFVPQMNVFILAMPIKSALAILILILYLNLMFEAFLEEMLVFIDFTSWMTAFLGG